MFFIKGSLCSYRETHNLFHPFLYLLANKVCIIFTGTIQSIKEQSLLRAESPERREKEKIMPSTKASMSSHWHTHSAWTNLYPKEYVSTHF
jgi:hypothetical protein